MKWKTKDGREIEVKDMETGHIKNAMAMLKRKGFVSQTTIELFLSDRPPNGEMALMAWKHEIDEVFSRPVAPILDELEAELARRSKEL